MRRPVLIVIALAVIACNFGCSGGSEISDENSIGPALKQAGVDPVGDSKGNSLPKADDQPKTTGGG